MSSKSKFADYLSNLSLDEISDLIKESKETYEKRYKSAIMEVNYTVEHGKNGRAIRARLEYNGKHYVCEKKNRVHSPFDLHTVTVNEKGKFIIGELLCCGVHMSDSRNIVRFGNI